MRPLLSLLLVVLCLTDLGAQSDRARPAPREARVSRYRNAAGEVLLVEHHGRRVGIVTRTDGGKDLIVDGRTEQLPREYRREAVPLRGSGRPEADLLATADPVVVTVLVAVTPAVEALHGGPDGTTALAQLLITNHNQALQDSAVTARFQAVGTYVLPNYQPTSDTSLDLQRLRNPGDGYYDGVHTARTSVAADIVALIGQYGNYCGQGYLTCGGSDCFSVADRNCALGNWSCSHEMGHNLGLHHDPANAGGGGQYASYSFGFIDPAYAFRTIMAYPAGGAPRVGRFSNPRVTYNGKTTGTATQDNARTMDDRAPGVSTFSGAAPAPTPTPKPCKGRGCKK